jgi:hypothetical protein
VTVDAIVQSPSSSMILRNKQSSPFGPDSSEFPYCDRTACIACEQTAAVRVTGRNL